jgi:Dolichyl-phosphate-mannose-protein mannosyltransferase
MVSASEARTGTRIGLVLRAQPLLTASVLILLLAGALALVAGTVAGLVSFTDVGYPDSATLLRLGQVVHSGTIYPDMNKPPYYASIYGPLTYALLAIPYKLGEAVGMSPQIPVRLAVLSTFCLCVWVIFRIGKGLNNSSRIGWFCVLFALSSLPMAVWTTQIRGDFPAVAFSLLSIYSFLLAERSGLTKGRGARMLVAAVFAGLAALVKQTFVAAPLAIMVWLLFRRRYKDALGWASVYVLTVAGGYALFAWHEPLMLQHMAALKSPIFEFREAMHITRNALSQPVAPLAAAGVLLIARKPTPERLLLLLYCVFAWFIAVGTIPQAGGNINYFWEPLLASAALAGPALWELHRRSRSTPFIVTALLLVLFIASFAPVLRDDLSSAAASAQSLRQYPAAKRRWLSFASAVSGRRVLSTMPAVSVLGRNPEMPEPGLNYVLERGGRWDPHPIVADTDAQAFDLVVIRKGSAENPENYRGLSLWSTPIWNAVKRAYRPGCLFDDKEVWLPRGGAPGIPAYLTAIGCEPLRARYVGAVADPMP